MDEGEECQTVIPFVISTGVLYSGRSGEIWSLCHFQISPLRPSPHALSSGRNDKNGLVMTVLFLDILVYFPFLNRKIFFPCYSDGAPLLSHFLYENTLRRHRC